MLFYIDILNTCNLKCIFCASGRGVQKRTNDLMSIELFDRITDKILHEAEDPIIGLYNWTEPFLHPDIGSFFQLLCDKKIKYTVSSNLSLPNIKDKLITFV